MTVTQFEVRPGAYFDSVVLMQLQKGLSQLDDVIDAGVVMATPANLDILEASGFSLPNVDTRPDDLLIVIRADSQPAAEAALAQVDELLQQRQSEAPSSFTPRTLSTAAQMLPDARWVLISVPGRFAAGLAEEALLLDKHVFLYSDNVTLLEEKHLKTVALERGLLVMGPDCGTALIDGAGLGFANRVRRGKVGIVAASGTGLQAVSAEVHNLGEGISQAFGTGGRDLSSEVAGVTTRQALRWLSEDEATRVIVLISKPPSPAVAEGLLRDALLIDKPIVIHFLGYVPPGRRIANLTFALDDSDAAELAVQLSREGVAAPRTPREPLRGAIRALFSGGTLAYQLLLGMRSVLSPLYSNLAADGVRALPSLQASVAHTVLDMGADQFTQGRLHPMMDQDLRLKRLDQEMADPDVDIIVLDVVLGEGAHEDPGAELAPAIGRAVRAGKRVAVLMVGTDADPQGWQEQMEVLAAAGAHIFASVTEVLDYIFHRLPHNPVPAAQLKAFHSLPLAAINVGLLSFHDSLVGQGAEVVQVDWRPPAGGDEQMMAILNQLKGL